MESLKCPFSLSLRWFQFPLLLLVISLGTASCASPPLDSSAEAALISRVEAKHDIFPTFVYGQSKAGNPVIYKPSLSGLRDFRKLFVLQADSYIIDLWLQATGSTSFILVLDFAALSNRMRMPTFDMWESFRTVVDPLSEEARSSIEQMVSRVFTRCEALVLINATSFLKMLKPAIAMMLPVSADKFFISTDTSALHRVVQPSEVPLPYNPSATAHVSYNDQTNQLYEILNARAEEVLGRPLEVTLHAPFRSPDAAEDETLLAATREPAAPNDSENSTDDDLFDDID